MTLPSPSAHDAARVVASALDAHHGERGALLPVLHDIQDALGFLPPEHLDVVAAALGLSRADVQGVVSFYHDFRTTPPAAHRIHLCRAEACRAMGAERLETSLRERLEWADWGGTVQVEPVHCLGNCALAPSVRVDGKLLGRATVERVLVHLDRRKER